MSAVPQAANRALNTSQASSGRSRQKIKLMNHRILVIVNEREHQSFYDSDSDSFSILLILYQQSTINVNCLPFLNSSLAISVFGRSQFQSHIQRCILRASLYIGHTVPGIHAEFARVGGATPSNGCIIPIQSIL